MKEACPSRARRCRCARRISPTPGRRDNRPRIVPRSTPRCRARSSASRRRRWAISTTARRWPRSWSRTEPATCSPMSAARITGARPGQIDLPRRCARRARRSSPSSTASPSTISSCTAVAQDAPTNFGDYAPRDFDGGFQGEITARDALRMSLNVPAVMVLERVGPLAFTQTLQNAGANLAFPGVPSRRCRWRSAVSASGSPTSRCSMPASPRADRALKVARHRRRAAMRRSITVRRGRVLVSAPDPRRRESARRLGDGAGAEPRAPSASRPARHMVSAMHGRWASRTTTPSACGWAAPTARRAPAASAATRPRPFC